MALVTQLITASLTPSIPINISTPTVKLQTTATKPTWRIAGLVTQPCPYPISTQSYRASRAWIWYSWVGSLVSNYLSKWNPRPTLRQALGWQGNDKVDSLRVGMVNHAQNDFWPDYNKAAGVYCVGEVFNGDASYTCPYQEVMDGVLNYPM